MSKIITYSLEHHTSLFTTENNENDYFYVQADNHPYISEPYRAESYAIEFLRKGSIIMQTRLSKIEIQAPAILTIGPSVIRSFTKNSEEILIDIIFFKPQFFLKNQANIFFLNQYDFFEISSMHAFQLEKDNIVKFEKLFTLIKEALSNNKLHQADILRSYLYILLLLLLLLLLLFELDEIKQTVPKSIPKNILFEKFKEILVKEFIQQRSVAYYANCLNVTAKHLSEVIKKIAEKLQENGLMILLF